jgi:hypothetical protein
MKTAKNDKYSCRIVADTMSGVEATAALLAPGDTIEKATAEHTVVCADPTSLQES